MDWEALMDWDGIAARLVTLFKEKAAKLGQAISGDVEHYFKTIADLGVLAARTGNAKMLRSLMGSVELLGALEEIRASDAFFDAIGEVLNIAGEVLLAVLAAIPKP